MYRAYTVELKPRCEYYPWGDRLRLNLTVRFGESDSLGTFHTWNSDHLLAIL